MKTEHDDDTTDLESKNPIGTIQEDQTQVIPETKVTESKLENGNHLHLKQDTNKEEKVKTEEQCCTAKNEIQITSNNGYRTTADEERNVSNESAEFTADARQLIHDRRPTTSNSEVRRVPEGKQTTSDMYNELAQ